MKAKKLPDAELEVLAGLWQRGGEATARELREALQSYRPMTHGSVMNLLKRLEEKGLVTRRKAARGKAFLFRAAQRPGPTVRRVVGKLLERVFGGKGVDLVASLFEVSPPSPREIDELERMLGELRERTAASPEEEPDGEEGAS